MAKKKAKKAKVKAKAKKSKKVVKAKKIKKVKAKAKKAVKPKKAAGPKEKVVGNIEHFFGHISVAAMKLKTPLKVGDMIHIVGPHNDFVQRIDSMQINHQDVEQAKKGEDIGFKVKQKVRVTDRVLLAPKGMGITAQPAAQPAIQAPISPAMEPKSAPQQKTVEKDPYGKTQFLGF